jgi:hypothetical protein
MSAYERLRAVRPAGDGGFVAVGYAQDADITQPTYRNALLVKVAGDGSIPYCGRINSEHEMTITDTDSAVLSANLPSDTPPVTWLATEFEPRDTAGVTTTTCSGSLGLQPRPEITAVPSRELQVVGARIRLDGLPVARDLEGSDLATYAWDLDGDGAFDDAVGAQVDHVWSTLGQHPVSVYVNLPSGKTVVGATTVPVTGVAVDAQPGTCANAWNPGVPAPLSVGVRGSKYVDVHEIDVASITLHGIRPMKWAYEDVSAEPKPDAGCSESSKDGIVDLHLLFDTASVRRALELLQQLPGHGGTLALRLTGSLTSGATFQGEDAVLVVEKDTDELVTKR